MDLFFSPLMRTPAAAAAVRLYSMRPNYTVVLVHDRIMPSNESIQQQHHKRERRATSGRGVADGEDNPLIGLYIWRE